MHGMLQTNDKLRRSYSTPSGLTWEGYEKRMMNVDLNQGVVIAIQLWICPRYNGGVIFNKMLARKLLPLRSLLAYTKYGCSSLEATKSLLAKNLFSIELISKTLNRRFLAMAYTPGVGAVCKAIEADPLVADVTTFRGRSIAIVTDGSVFGVDGEAFLPVMDWLISQIKYYSNLDAFPIVVRSATDLESAFEDISNSYGTILYLDSKPIKKIPTNVLFLRQQEIAKIAKCEVTNLALTSSVLAYLISNKIKGEVSEAQIKDGFSFKTDNFLGFVPYGFELKDGRSIETHSMQIHKFYKGKIQIQVNFHDIEKLKPYFTEAILRKLVKEEDVYSKTARLSAIVTDGTSILGYGNIGPIAGLPVMEGKSLLFKLLGDVQVVPICINPRPTVESAITSIINIASYFDAINLQDIKAPECFDIEEGLNNLRVLPIFHDDQHGTAIVTLAGLINAAKVAEKNLHDCKCVINGAGAAGITIAKLLLSYGVKDIIICDSTGTIYKDRTKNMNLSKKLIAEKTNRLNINGDLADAMKGADIFIGVSIAGALKGEWIEKMNTKSIVLAMANPLPEIMPDEAKTHGAYIYGSGRSDFENQINNSLVFPGIFRGIVEHRIKEITQEMKIRASEAIAQSIEGLPTRKYIIPDSLDKDVAIRISRQLGKIAARDRKK